MDSGTKASVQLLPSPFNLQELGFTHLQVVAVTWLSARTVAKVC